jgi:adenylylsulfate kinase-like enzyme
MAGYGRGTSDLTGFVSPFTSKVQLTHSCITWEGFPQIMAHLEMKVKQRRDSSEPGAGILSSEIINVKTL